jgi:peptidase M64-like protein
MIIRPIILVTALLILATSAFAAETVRVDYYHTGDATQEIFSLDRVVIEPLPWPGNPRQNIDASNLGKYFFEVRDAKTKQLLYSRGFASIYGEWETTDEAKSIKRTFQESLRFPAPAAPVTIVLRKRDAKNAFVDIWITTIDPADQFVDRSKPIAPAPLLTIQKTGAGSRKCCLLLPRSKKTAATSTCGPWPRRPLKQESRGRQPAFIATRPSARLTTPSAPNDMY